MKVVFIVPKNNFRDQELFIPKVLIANKGIECVIASKYVSSLKGMTGTIVESTLALSKVDNSFDAIIFIGGEGAREYFEDAEALALAKKYFEMNRVVAAICIAPSILANAGILNGKKAVCFASEMSNLTSKGAICPGGPIMVDGKIITAAGPLVAKQFGEEIVKALKK
ncbi:MAG: DJ-1/PfpI family protein [archaeon]|jgi:protease I